MIQHKATFGSRLLGGPPGHVAVRVTNADIGPGISWTLLLFMGGIFSLSNVLTEYKITDWLAGYFVPIAQRLISPPGISITLWRMPMRQFGSRPATPQPIAFAAIPIAPTAIC